MAIIRSAPGRFGMPAVSGFLAGVLGAVSLAACTGGGGAVTLDDGGPRSGGTLRLIGSWDVDRFDPAAAVSASSSLLLRATSRQLVSYPAPTRETDKGSGTGPGVSAGGPDSAPPEGQDVGSAARDPVPDLAEALPAVSAGRTVYTFRLRSGARWDTSPSRQIVAADVVRGFQRLCNPASSEAMPAYLPSLVAGMAQYCAGFAQVPPEVGAIRRYVEANRIAGVRALDDLTVQFALTRPAADFLEILAKPFASPMPVEALDELPGSTALRQHFVSSGPYTITRYVPGRGLTLARNPAWRPDTDPIRKAYVDRIEITLGMDARSVQRRLEAGGADLSWDTDVPPGDLARLAGSKDPKLVFAADGAGEWYLAVRFASQNENHAMANLRVRQALNYAVDKSALVNALGGRQLWWPRDQILPPSDAGYEEFNLYPTPEHRGDPGTARQMLADAGYPHGLTLTLTYPAGATGRRLAGTLRDQLAKGGVTLLVSPRRAADSSGQAQDSLGARAAGEWDLALVDADPEPPGAICRAVFTRLFMDSGPDAILDTGLHRQVEHALAASSDEEAAARWARADKHAMQLAARVPLVLGHAPRYHGARVNGWTVTAEFPRGDLTGVWLKEPARD